MDVDCADGRTEVAHVFDHVLLEPPMHEELERVQVLTKLSALERV